MNTIATLIDDNAQQLNAMVAQQQGRPGYAMDPYFYRSHLVYQRELDAILYRSWLYAGHISQIPESGDYFLYAVGEDSIIVTRDDAGVVRALMNICRHRGARVCETTSGHRKTLVCPYHGWVYNLDGSLRAARSMDRLEGFNPDHYGLKQAQLCIYQGLIFVNCDNAATPFEVTLKEIGDALAPYALADAKVAHAQVYPVQANWKFALENYLECYHCATAHRAYAKLHTLQELDGKVSHVNEAMLARAAAATGVPGVTLQLHKAYTQSEVFGSDVYHSRYALYDGFKTGSEDGQPVAPLMGEFRGYDGGAGDFQLGPLCFMLNYPDHCVLYRFTPRGMTQTDMEIVWFVRADAEEGVDYDLDTLTWLWHHTTQEDEYIIRRNAEGANSRFFEPGPYHPDFEYLCNDFVSWYLQALAH
ncbi:MAG: aromatic ring-hydroxylating dioxygenase subunit alpha [Pseudomonadota bacterium]